MEVMKKIKSNPAIVFVGCMFILSMFFGYKYLENKTIQSDLRVAEIQRKSDSTTKSLNTELILILEKNLALREELRQVKSDSTRLHNEIKSLRKIVKIYVQTKDNAAFDALNELSRAVTKLEAKQRERESRQRERQRQKD